MFELEKIYSKENSNTVILLRWHIFKCSLFKIYLHKFIRSDDRIFHDHPKHFISIGIWGGYDEQTPEGWNRFRSPWIRHFPPEYKHRVVLNYDKPCWTVVIVGKHKKQWSFYES